MKKYEQGTPEWLEMRRSKVTASEAPIILGLSPYCTPLELWKRKMSGEVIPDTPPMAWGRQNEGPARERYVAKTGNHVEPAVVLHPKYEWMMASLDGVTFARDAACEIKSNGRATHEKAVNGEISEHHRAQMQFQMACAEIDKIDYVSDNGTDCVIITVPKQNKWLDKHYDKFHAFYQSIQNNTPPEYSEKDCMERDDYLWLGLMENYCKIDSTIRELEEERTKIKSQLIEISDGRSCCGGGGALKKRCRKGSIDYKKIDALKDVDLEQYRKSSSTYWVIEMQN